MVKRAAISLNLLQAAPLPQFRPHSLPPAALFSTRHYFPLFSSLGPFSNQSRYEMTLLLFDSTLFVYVTSWAPWLEVLQAEVFYYCTFVYVVFSVSHFFL